MECNDFSMIFPYADVTTFSSSAFVVRDKTKETLLPKMGYIRFSNEDINAKKQKMKHEIKDGKNFQAYLSGCSGKVIL